MVLAELLQFKQGFLYHLCIAFQNTSYYNIIGNFKANVCYKHRIAFLPFGSDKKTEE